MTSALLILCGGFLLAVLWMDLMFDVQVLHYRQPGDLPEDVLASIGAYYRRVTTEARPMGHAVAGAMVVAIATVAVQIASGGPALWVGWLSLPLCGAPILLALLRVVPNAVRLGSRTDSISQQSVLARAICRDHLFCFAGIAGFVAVQVIGGR